MHSSLITGSMPGIRRIDQRDMGHRIAPTGGEAPEKSFESTFTWA